jgi:hypothetical protein
MTTFSVDLEWWRDAKGYRLDEAVPPKKPAPDDGFLLIGALGQPQRVVRLGGDLISYRPLAEFGNSLCTAFAKADTPEKILNFIGRFGPLTEAGLKPGEGEEVPPLLTHAEAMHNWLTACLGGRRDDLHEMIGPKGIPLRRLQAVLAVDPLTGAPRMKFAVQDLLSGLWLQFGQTLSGDVDSRRIKECRHCGEIFEAGPGTGRRLDAEFCSDAHRVAFNSLKRSKPA